MDDEEIQPESPVTLTIQMLDEKGMPDGSPITIVHFAEDGAEVLDGSRVENRSTTFKLESFSEIAIGCRPTSDGAIYISQSFRYETDAFRMTFKVQGEAVPAEGEDALPEDAKDVISDEIRPVKSGITAPAEETKETEKTEPAEGEEKDNSEQIDGEVTDSEQEPTEGEEADSENKADEEVKENDKKDDSENEEIKENPEAEPQQEDPEEETKEESKEAEAEEDSEKQEDAAENADSDNEETEGSEETDTEEDASVEEDGSEENPEEADTEEKEEKKEEKEEKTDRLQFCLELADKNSGEYQAFVDYIGEDALKSDAHLMLQVMQYTLTYDDIELDVSECEITAEFLPTQKLVNYAEGSDSAPDDFEVSEEQRELEEEVGREVTIGIYQQSEDAQVEQVGEVFLGEEKELEDIEVPAIDSTKTDNDTTASAEDVQTLKLTAETIVVSDVLRATAPEQETGEVTSGEEDGTSDVPGGEDDKVSDVPEKQESRPAAAGVEPVVFELNTSSKVFAVRATGQPNLAFTVQYYAKIPVLATEKPEGGSALTILDTDAGGNGQNVGKTERADNLPKNGVSNSQLKKKEIYINGDGKIQTEDKEIEVYKERKFAYRTAPTINYFNALLNNPGYELKQIKVHRADKAESIWEVYNYSKDLHFTNRSDVENSAVPGGSSGYIWISPNATIRLVYEAVEESGKGFDASFYDYDISSKVDVNGDAFTMHTANGGINAAERVGNGDARYAFGNVNCGTNYGNDSWSGYTLNAYNHKNSSFTGDGRNTNYGGGCTFGLVNGMTDGGKNVTFSRGISAPKNLFGGGSANGKHPYEGSLTFQQKGDTYTLTAATTANNTVNNLQQFRHPVAWDGSGDMPRKVHTHIWTNDFWPMDNVLDENRTDKNFGRAGGSKENTDGSISILYPGNQKYKNDTKTDNLPVSDDGDKDHNCFFGMSYQVNFELSKDYIGPLEYYFFGDDDMWVFLSELNEEGDIIESTSKLVCDIGGVHSSVGEYVNLWDYLSKNENMTHEHVKECYGEDAELVCAKKYALSFFYTERGASGSTCWMQFTLPSVTSASTDKPQTDYGKLRIDKQVMKENNDGTLISLDTQEEFKFNITLKKGNDYLPDDYSYVKYRRNEGGEATVISEDLLVHDGGSFTLRGDEYIIVKFIPVGTQYIITECNDVVEVENRGTEQEKDKITEGDYVYKTDVIVNGVIDVTKKDLSWDKDKENIKTAEGTITFDKDSTVQYINKFQAYALPKTGGLGAVDYTETGIVLMILAGTFYFIYRRRKNIGRGC